MPKNARMARKRQAFWPGSGRGAGAGGVMLASGDAFIADTATRDVLGKRADLADMEGYALATAAAAAAVPVGMAKHVVR